MVGKEVGQYRITAELGRGGMAEVCRATDTQLQREVALKILPGSVASDPQRAARFEREATILASLNHPHIASIYGLASAAGIKALVLELVEGPTLAEVIRKEPLTNEKSPRNRTGYLRRPGSSSRKRNPSPRPQAGQHQVHPRKEGQDP